MEYNCQLTGTNAQSVSVLADWGSIYKITEIDLSPRVVNFFHVPHDIRGVISSTKDDFEPHAIFNRSTGLSVEGERGKAVFFNYLIPTLRTSE